MFHIGLDLKRVRLSGRVSQTNRDDLMEVYKVINKTRIERMRGRLLPLAREPKGLEMDIFGIKLGCA